MVLAMALAVGMAASAAQAQILAWWKLDESEGTIAREEINPGIWDMHFLRNPIWVPDGGVFDGCIYFHGGYERLETDSSLESNAEWDTYLDLPGIPFTFALWFKIDGDNWNTNSAEIAGKSTYYHFYRNGSNVNVTWSTYHGGGNSPSFDPTDRNWHHLCGTYDGESLHSFYIDGDLAVDWIQEGSVYIGGTRPFAIGGNNYNASRGMKGWIDDVCIFGMELNASQVKELKKFGPDKVNLPPVVDAGPPQIKHLPNEPGAYATFTLRGSCSDQTLLGPNELRHEWRVVEIPTDWQYFTVGTGPPANLWFEPNEFILDAKVHMNITGYYKLALQSSDGVYDANDFFICDVRSFGWKGEVVKWDFEGNLEDTARDQDPVHPIYDNLNPVKRVGFDDEGFPVLEPLYLGDYEYVEGIEGQAIELKVIDLPELEVGESGSMLKCDPTFETALHGFGTWTTEFYIKVDPVATWRPRLIYIWNVEYDRGYGNDTSFDDGNTDMWYSCLEPVTGGPAFGINAIQSNGLAFDMRWGYQNYSYETRVPFDTWNHVAWTGDGYYITIWVNGDDVFTQPYDGTIAFSLTRPDGNVADDGVRISSTQPERCFAGALDSIMINLQAKRHDYFKDRVMLIPILLAYPENDFEYTSTETILKWLAGKGPFNYNYTIMVSKWADKENPLLYWWELGETTDITYQVQPGQLEPDTLYRWYVKTEVDGVPQSDNESDKRWFYTLPDGYEEDGLGLIGHWKFDEGAGGIVHDSGIGINRTGTNWDYHGEFKGVGNDPNWTTGWIAPAGGNAGLFSGKVAEDALVQDNYVVIVEPNLLDPPETWDDKYFGEDPTLSDPCIFKDLPLDCYSLALWFNTGVAGFQTQYSTMLSQGDAYTLRRSSNSNYALFNVDVEGGVIQVGGTQVNVAAQPTNVNDAAWHHIVGVYDNINDVVSIYVDGELEDTASFDYRDLDDTHTLDTTAELWIGGNYRSNINRRFSGTIDDVRIYQHTALTSDQVKDLYDMGFLHKRPVVEAGDYQILEGPPTYSTTLAGEVDDDNLPPQGATVVQWTVEDKPAGSTVTIDSAGAKATDVDFDLPGVYTLRLTCKDNDAYSAWDEVKIWCQPAADMNAEIFHIGFEEDMEYLDPCMLKVPHRGQAATFGEPYINVPIDLSGNRHANDPNFVAKLDPNVPRDKIWLADGTEADNNFSVGRNTETTRLYGTVNAYDELTYPEDITVEFFAYIGDEDFFEEDSGDDDEQLDRDELTLINHQGLLKEGELVEGGFWIYAPGNLTVRYLIDDTQVIGRHDTITLRTNINLCAPQWDPVTEQDDPVDDGSVGWTHVAWTYNHKTGMSHVFANGVPGMITHVNGVAQLAEYYYDGPDNRRLLMPPVINLIEFPELPKGEVDLLHIGGDEIGSGKDYVDSPSMLDEFRITAEVLPPLKFMIKAPNHCIGKLPADLNGDCVVDLVDYAILSANYLVGVDK